MASQLPVSDRTVSHQSNGPVLERLAARVLAVRDGGGRPPLSQAEKDRRYRRMFPEMPGLATGDAWSPRPEDVHDASDSHAA